MGLILIAAGIFVSFVGWIYLLEGVSVGVGGGMRDVVNLHKLSIANNIVLLGYVLVVIGLIIRLSERYRRTENVATEQSAVTSETVSAERPGVPSEKEKQPPIKPPDRFNKEQREEMVEHFKSQFKKTVLVRPDGSVKLFTTFNSREFATVEDAETYCRSL